MGYRVEDTEDDQLAAEMFRDAFHTQDTIPAVVHSDGGPSMTSNIVTTQLRQQGIEISKNRPRVANHNPFSEAMFKLAKYRVDYPKYFATLQDAQAYVDAFVTWYSIKHRHSELEGHTPASIHDGTWQQIHQQRQHAMEALATTHPSRYTTRPVLQTPKAQVGINTSKNNKRLTTV